MLLPTAADHGRNGIREGLDFFLCVVPVRGIFSVIVLAKVVVEHVVPSLWLLPAANEAHGGEEGLQLNVCGLEREHELWLLR